MLLILRFLLVSCVAISISWSLEEDDSGEDKACMLQNKFRTASSMSVSLEKKVRFEPVLLETGKTTAVHKQEYHGVIEVGSPLQKFTVVYDTGSGNLLLPGENCKDEACLKHHRYALEKSSTHLAVGCNATSHDPKDGLTIHFGTGHITGKCVQDKICIRSVCTTGTFLAATEESTFPFGSFKFDGVLGLAPDTMAHAPEYSLMHRMVRDKALVEPVFSVFLSDSEAEGSEITFGSVKKEQMASELFWVPVSRDSGYWEVQIDDITLSNKKTKICENCYVAVDTGTSELAGPTTIINELRKKLNVDSNCKNLATLPNLGFAFGSRILNLKPNDYLRNDGVSCDLAMMGLDVPPPKGPLFIFGIPFLQKFFTVYDHARKRVGFAAAKHKGTNPPALVTVLENEEPHESVLDQGKPQI